MDLVGLEMKVNRVLAEGFGYNFTCKVITSLEKEGLVYAQ